MGAERAERILDAAAELIARYGYAKTSVSDVARAAGIAKGAIYREYPSKEAVLEALLDRQTRRLTGTVARAVREDPAGARLSTVYRHALGALAADPLMRALYTADSQVLGDVVRRRGPERYGPRQRLVVEFVSRMQRAGLIRADLAAEAVAHVLGILSVGLVAIESTVGSEAAPPLEETLEALSALLADGFEAGPGADSADGRRVFDSFLADLAAAAQPPPDSARRE